MSKLKTRGSIKKRFSLTATGKVRAAQTGKKHNMRKRSKRQLRDQRGSTVLNDVETRRIKAFMPYSL